MKKILFTGGTGFLGRNLLPALKKKYDVCAPSRNELNITDLPELKRYITAQNFDVIIHAAIPNISFHKDKKETLLKDSLSTFMQLHQLQDYYGKMLYFGSGAEFNKALPITAVKETDFGSTIPTNDYGLSKYIMNTLCRESSNIYNLRIFGCYGPTDAAFKFITYVIRCCLDHSPIKLHQNCMFDFMWVMDLIPVLEYFISEQPQYHDYNICTGVSTELLHLCQSIQNQMGTDLPVSVEAEGFNHAYTGDNSRILQEIAGLNFTLLADGIKQQIEYEKEAYNNGKESR